MEAVFDYDKQEYFDGDEIIQPKDNWDFPCPICLRPSEMYALDCYGEYHKCLNPSCNHKFTVK